MAPMGQQVVVAQPTPHLMDAVVGQQMVMGQQVVVQQVPGGQQTVMWQQPQQVIQQGMPQIVGPAGRQRRRRSTTTTTN